MLVLLGPEEQTFSLLHEPRVRVLHELSGVRSDALVERPVRLYGVDRGEAVAASEAGVLLAVGRGDVHQARALGRGDVLTRDHRPQVLVLFGPLHGHVVEGAPIPQPFELRTLARLQDLVVPLAQHAVEQVARQDQPLPIDLGGRVVQFGVGRDGGVGDEGPRGRGPDEQAGFPWSTSGNLTNTLGSTTGSGYCW